MSQALYYPTPSLSLSAIGANGSAIPTTSLLVAGSDGTNLQPLKVDSSGHLIIDGTTTGGATAANQVLEIAQLTGIHSDTTSIDGKLPASLGAKTAAASLSIVLASDGTLPLPSGAATAANQATEIASLASIDGKTPALGQALAAASVPVVLTAAQLSTLTPLTSVTVTQATGTNLHVVVDSSGLPSGAATAANQATEIASLASIDGKTPALGQALAAASVPVVLTASQLSTLTPLSTVAATQSGTWNINNVSGTVSLPTGASTAANQSTANTSLSSIDGKFGSLGQKAMSGSAPVVIASDQSALPATKGRALANAPVRNDYTSVNVLTSGFTQLVASTTSVTNKIQVFDSSGQTMALAVGAAASEVIQCYIFPGGQGDIEIAIPASSRVSIKAISANATVGEIDINFLT